MTVNRTATQAGKKYERDLLNYFRSHGYDVERLRLAGKEDEGDLVVRSIGEPDRWIIEAKREKGFNLAGWIKEAEVEANNYADHRTLYRPPFVVVHAARGKGIGDSYVTTKLSEFVTWVL